MCVIYEYVCVCENALCACMRLHLCGQLWSCMHKVQSGWQSSCITASTRTVNIYILRFSIILFLQNKWTKVNYYFKRQTKISTCPLNIVDSNILYCCSAFLDKKCDVNIERERWRVLINMHTNLFNNKNEKQLSKQNRDSNIPCNT